MLEGIKNIIFDLGGVILDIDIEKTKQAFRDLGFSEIDQLFGLGHADAYFLEHEAGRISDDEFLAKIAGSLDGSRQDQIIKAWNAMLLEFPEERIDKLKELAKSFRLFLYSNTNGIHHRAFGEIFQKNYPQYQFDRLFEKAYYSHVFGIRKPDKEGFEKILSENNLLASETLFVDDAEINLKGAAEAGLKTFHIRDGLTILDLH